MTTIALLHYSAPPVVGGVESVMEHHARLLTAAGHTVRLVAGRGQPTDRRIALFKIPLMDSRHSRVLAAKQALDAGRQPAGWARLVNDIQQRLADALAGVELVIAHNVASLHKNLALTQALYQLAQQPGFGRLVLWHHDVAWGALRYNTELHPGPPWELLHTPWPNATHVTISAARQAELAALLQLPREEIRVIPNGVSPRLFYKLGRTSIGLLQRLDLLAASPLLLMPVRLTRRKNIELALHTLAALRTKMPAARLLVTGPLGPHNPANQSYFEALLRLRAELGLQAHAHFLAEHVEGFIPDEVISDFYQLADALFFPSQDEGFGIPLLEAGLAQIPVFCSAIPALQELGAQDVSYFAPDANPESVATLIYDQLQASATWRLRARVRSQYTWQQIYTHHLAPLVSP
ncbi:MAG: glycosyltransferase family 4 protein [Anaerolineales bacterium]|nr:glycosyltransferase family 4 protein [Anaerolineales bacterium]